MESQEVQQGYPSSIVDSADEDGSGPPASAPVPVEPFRFADPRQDQIYRRLLLVGPGPGAFFRDACRLMAEAAPFEATSHLVSHLMREIDSAVRAVLGTLVEEPDVPGRQAEEDRHRASILAILKALEIPEEDPVAQAWLGLTGSGNPYGLSALAHRDALARPRSVDAGFRTYWEQFQAVLDYVLDRFESRFLQPHALVDRLLARGGPPTAEDLRILRNQVPNNPITLGYFFDRLDNAAWLEPLAAEGFFSHPLDPVREEQGRIAFPAWPQSRFLARAAKAWPESAETVLNVALAMPETDNARVRDDIADVALNVPSDLAARLVPRLAGWIASPYHFSLPSTLGELVSHLARGGQVAAALELASALLEIPPPAVHRSRLALDPQAWIDGWEYEQILQQHIPELVDAAGVDALELLCDLVEQAIRAYLGEAGTPPTDHSYVWRPAIEEHEQNLDQGIRHALVSAVRDAAERLVQQDPATISDVVAALEARSWNVFRRLALHLLRSPGAPLDLVAAHLTRREDFDDADTWHEYAVLISERFGSLSPADQDVILGWIDRGPEREPEDGRDREVPEHDARVKWWKVYHLTPFADSLPDGWRQKYGAWVKEVGVPEHADFAIYSGSWEGDPTPKSAAQLSSMSVAEIVAFLRAWQPPEDTSAGSPREGLRLSLTSAVASDPERFAAEAHQFKELDPKHVHAVLSGLSNALTEKRTFPWPSILDLCAWVMGQPREIPGRTGRYADLDPGWVWTRKTIADLLVDALSPEPNEMPIALRDQAWSVVRRLVDDPDPTPEHEARFGGSNMDPATLSLNTIRGKAMHAVIAYALWVWRHQQAPSSETGEAPWDFDRSPEVREVLEAHLDPSVDPSLAIRAVYGWKLLSLVALDPRWVDDRLSAIFPPQHELKELREVAWEAYVVFCGTNRQAFDLLREEYRAGVERLGMDRSGRRYPRDPDGRLAEHLMTLYWHGMVELDDPLLAAFWARASDGLRGHALRFIGRSLAHTDEILGAVVERLERLWENRLQAAQGAPASHVEEKASFGWWFISGKLSDGWAIRQLREAAAIAGKADPSRMVVDRLAELAGDAALDAVECLEQLVRGDREGWGIYAWRHGARRILATAINGADARARAAAIALVNRLGARGVQEFRDLLPGT